MTILTVIESSTKSVRVEIKRNAPEGTKQLIGLQNAVAIEGQARSGYGSLSQAMQLVGGANRAQTLKRLREITDPHTIICRESGS